MLVFAWVLSLDFGVFGKGEVVDGSGGRVFGGAFEVVRCEISDGVAWEISLFSWSVSRSFFGELG